MNTFTPIGQDMMPEFDCPQCGEPTEVLHEGYCGECYQERQRALDLHNAEQDRWNKLSDAERWSEIRKAGGF